jgi:hypothetical protein
VGLGGVEPPTSPLSGVRSNHLSYRPKRLYSRFLALVRSFLRFASCIVYNSVSLSYQLSSMCEYLFFFGFNHLTQVKEVIQPQVPLRLPCYDFTPVMNHTVVIAPLAVKLTTSGTTHSHGVTGGVYKARERIHRGVLIRDY